MEVVIVMPEERTASTPEEVFDQEQEYLQHVFDCFDEKIEEAKESFESISIGSDHDAFLDHSQAAASRKNLLDLTEQFHTLRAKPYFAHLRLKEKNEDNLLDCFLSDDPDLKSMICLNSDVAHEIYILPFKQDDKRKFWNDVFHLYRAQREEQVDFGDAVYLTSYIRDDEIVKQQLLSAIQTFPFLEEGADVVKACDELLSNKLKENRKDPVLRNIISSLQRLQFQIIETDADVPFVVQGCAGSGKSQCLIHRLFFLRDVLQKDWDRVLMITPSQLFRNYSSELMRRFHLETVTNMSIASLYREMLERIDGRFKNRQYRFELSEEYLPDQYLHQVYTRENISGIREEIIRAIRSHVENACILLGLPVPERLPDLVMVKELAEALQREIEEFDQREKALEGSQSLSETRKIIEELNRRSVTLRHDQERIQKRLDELDDRKEKYDQLVDYLADAIEKLNDWDDKFEEDKRKCQETVKEKASVLRQTSLSPEDSPATCMSALSDYAAAVFSLLDYSEPEGKKRQQYENDRLFLVAMTEEYEADISEYVHGRNPKDWKRTLEKDFKGAEARMKKCTDEIRAVDEELEERTKWLVAHMDDDQYQQQNSARRASLVQENYYLSRLESSVFESEVWKALLPLKQAYGVHALDVEKQENGKNRETRILYKSDLMFYLRVYATLGELRNLPDYRLICIDEGQDLHPADYELIRELFPGAVLNVFGDRAQSLHEDCGVEDWNADTGIEKVFRLDKNYRNPPDIVEFCNRRFHESMEYCGSLESERLAEETRSLEDLREYVRTRKAAVIVKDRTAFQKLREELPSLKLCYLDMDSSEVARGMVPCYSVHAAKGLEFSHVAVIPDGMSHNQQVVACTRATESLLYADIGGEQ